MCDTLNRQMQKLILRKLVSIIFYICFLASIGVLLHTLNQLTSLLFTFMTLFFSVMKDSVPVVKIKSQSYPQCYTHDLINSIKHIDKLRKKYLRCARNKPSTEYYNFSRVRAEVKKNV